MNTTKTWCKFFWVTCRFLLPSRERANAWDIILIVKSIFWPGTVFLACRGCFHQEMLSTVALSLSELVASALTRQLSFHPLLRLSSWSSEGRDCVCPWPLYSQHPAMCPVCIWCSIIVKEFVEGRAFDLSWLDFQVGEVGCLWRWMAVPGSRVWGCLLGS